MTVSIEAHLTRVGEAEKKVYTLQEKVREGDITEGSLAELGDAYEEYLRIRSEKIAPPEKPTTKNASSKR